MRNTIYVPGVLFQPLPKDAGLRDVRKALGRAETRQWIYEAGGFATEAKKASDEADRLAETIKTWQPPSRRKKRAK